MFPDQEEPALFARQLFTLEEVSPEIHTVARNNFSAMLKKIAQVSLESIGDKLCRHKSNICRMKDNGDFAWIASVNAAVGYDLVAMEEEIKELRRQNEAIFAVGDDHSASDLGC